MSKIKQISTSIIILIICLLFGVMSNNAKATERATQGTMLGDVNLDGSVSLEDVIYLNKKLAGVIDFNEQQIANADCNQYGSDNTNRINALDAVVLLQYIVEKVPELPVGNIYKIEGISYNYIDDEKINLDGVTFKKDEEDFTPTIKLSPKKIYEDYSFVYKNAGYIDLTCDVYDGDNKAGSLRVLVGKQGDVNLDKNVDLSDVTEILNIINGSYSGKISQDNLDKCQETVLKNYNAMPEVQKLMIKLADITDKTTNLLNLDTEDVAKLMRKYALKGAGIEYYYVVDGASYNYIDDTELNLNNVTIKKYEIETDKEVEFTPTIKLTPKGMYENVKSVYDQVGYVSNENCIVYDGDKMIGRIHVLIGKKGDVNFDGKVDNSDVTEINKIVDARYSGNISQNKLSGAKTVFDNYISMPEVQKLIIKLADVTDESIELSNINEQDALAVAEMYAEAGAGLNQ